MLLAEWLGKRLQSASGWLKSSIAFQIYEVIISDAADSAFDATNVGCHVQLMDWSPDMEDWQSMADRSGLLIRRVHRMAPQVQILYPPPEFYYILV